VGARRRALGTPTMASRHSGAHNCPFSLFAAWRPGVFNDVMVLDRFNSGNWGEVLEAGKLPAFTRHLVKAWYHRLISCVSGECREMPNVLFTAAFEDPCPATIATGERLFLVSGRSEPCCEAPSTSILRVLSSPLGPGTSCMFKEYMLIRYITDGAREIQLPPPSTLGPVRRKNLSNASSKDSQVKRGRGRFDKPFGMLCICRQKSLSCSSQKTFSLPETFY
jgi:hypothetical protein